MTLEQIAQVVEIAKLNSITQAADALFISQPSLSLSIQHLEEELGETLFIRTNKGVRLTPFGKEFISYAQTILEQTAQLSNLGKDKDRRYKAKLSVASFGYRFVTDICARLYQEHQDSCIQISIDDSVNYDVIDLIADNLCQIGVTRIWSFQRSIMKKQMHQKNVQFFPLTRVPLTVVVGRGSPLYYAESDVICKEDLARFPLVTYSYSNKGPYAGVMREVGLPPSRDCIIVNSRASNFEMLDRVPCYYVSATPHPAYQHADYYPGARSLRLADCDITAEIGWVKNESYHLSPLANEFVKILTGYFD